MCVCVCVCITYIYIYIYIYKNLQELYFILSPNITVLEMKLPRLIKWPYTRTHQEMPVPCSMQGLLFLIWFLRNITVDIQQ